MKLKLLKDDYVFSTSKTESIFSIAREFLLENEVFKKDFVFEGHMHDYINTDFKTHLTEKINRQGYMKVEGFIITCQEVNEVIHRVMIFKT